MADSMNGKKALAGSIDFTLPGFSNIDDPELLQKLLAEYITRVREIEAADTTRCPARLPARSRREKDAADPEAHTAPTFDDFASSASTAISLFVGAWPLKAAPDPARTRTARSSASARRASFPRGCAGHALSLRALARLMTASSKEGSLASG